MHHCGPCEHATLRIGLYYPYTADDARRSIPGEIRLVRISPRSRMPNSLTHSRTDLPIYLPTTLN